MNGGGANDFEHIVKRKYLFAYETVPARMLKVYGLATFPDLSDEAVWACMKQLLKSGCPYMTEYCSGETERRGIAFNRFCLFVLSWLRHNMSEKIAAQNKFLLEPRLFKELEEEDEESVFRILPCTQERVYS